MERNVVVIIGVGGMGLAIAKRLGIGRHLIIADYSEKTLQTAVIDLQTEGYQVQGHKVDVADRNSVLRLAETAAVTGKIENVIQTAGVSPINGTVDQIYQINLLGAANVIEVFQEFARPGMAMVCIASISGLWGDYSAEFSEHLAMAPPSKILDHPELKVDHLGEHASFVAYQHAKRSNILRVQVAATAYGRKGARINSVSPGFIMTPMGRAEIAGPLKELIMKTVDDSPTKRAGTPADIARAVAFLCSPESSFITGTDLPVDGGEHSARKWLDLIKSKQAS